jgi:hypothetical protein
MKAEVVGGCGDGDDASIEGGQPMSAELVAGVWKLVSWQVVTDGQAKDLFGSKPKGYLILTREGRAMALTTADARTPGETEAERAALHKSMLAYTGKYRLEGDEIHYDRRRLME